MKTAATQCEDEHVRKYVTVKIGNKDVKMQLDSGSDLSIINFHTWKTIGKPEMMRTTKVARSVTGERIKFHGEVVTNVTLRGKNLKLKVFISKNTSNLFGTDWIQKFKLWDSPTRDFCKKVKNLTAEAEKLKKELKESFPNIYSEKIGRCTKRGAKFELQNKVTPVFKKKRNVPFTRLNAVLKDHHYPLPNPKKKYMPGEKVLFQMHKDNTTFWEQGKIKNRIGRMVYIVEGPHYTHKKHLNQLKIRISDDPIEAPNKYRKTPYRQERGID